MVDVLLTILVFFMMITSAQVLKVDKTITLPVAPDAVIAATASDKKRKAGRVRFILIRGIAEPYIVDDVGEASLQAALKAIA